MRRLKKDCLGWILVAAVFAACGAPLPPESVAEPVDASEAPTAINPASTHQPQATIELSTLEPQRIEFQSADGTPLVGTFWPPTQQPAPGVVLMHMMGKDKDSWHPLPALLQGVGLAHEGAQGQSYAVFAFDFRGHGESGGGPGDRAGMLEDARSAFSTFQALPGVNPDRILLIGASIGADAAIDVCGQGCIGAVSLSPGGYLGVPYNDALVTLANKPVLCAASEGDIPPAQTCQKGEQLDLTDYRVQIYAGANHGTDMFAITDQQPMLTDLIFQWLADHVHGK